MEEERRQLMADHGTGITDGLAHVEDMGKGRFLVVVEGIKFEMPKGAAEELLYTLTKALRPYAGYSIFDEIMMNLDAVIDRLMSGEPAKDGRDPGRAETFTMCLAIIRNPHSPDFPGEKKRQMERYEKRQSSETQSEDNRVEHKRSQRPGRNGHTPEPEPEEVWACGECETEYDTEMEANECALADMEAHEEEEE
jgi:hypothetical protein